MLSIPAAKLCRPVSRLLSAVLAGPSTICRLPSFRFPPPNRTFRWCTERMKIDPVNALVKQRVGHWGEAILHLGARRAESSTRAHGLPCELLNILKDDLESRSRLT